MIEINQILLSDFSSTLDRLVHYYNYLSSLSPNDREMFVAIANQRLLETEKKIQSEKTVNALKILHFYQWAGIFGFKMRYESCKNPSMRNSDDAKIRYVDSLLSYCCPGVSHLSIGKNHPIKDWIYTSPSEQEYFETIWPYFEKIHPFCLKVDSLCHEIDITYQQKSLDIVLRYLREASECDQKYKYEIHKWEKSWFKSKITLDDINQRWSLQKYEIKRFNTYISPFYNSLVSSVIWLHDLRREDIELGICVCDLNKAASALQEGTKLKHLLMEEGFARMEIAKLLGE